MKTSLNVIRVGLGATLCVGLLAACDNRSATPFKSKTWSQEQIMENQKALGGGPNAPSNPDGAINTGANIPALPDGESSLVTPKPAPQPAKDGAAANPSVNTGGAQSKFGVEFDRREEGQRKSSKFETLKAAVDEALKKGVDPELATLIPQFSVTVEGQQKPYGMSIKAALNLMNQPVLLLVKQATVDTPVGDEVIPLAAELHKDINFADAPQKLGNSLYVWAFCPAVSATDKNACDNILLILDMRTVSNQRKLAVFALQKENGKFRIINSNVGDVKPFEGKPEEAAEGAGTERKAGEATEEGGASAASKNDKGEVNEGAEKSQNSAEAGAAGKDAPSSGSADDKSGAKAENAAPAKQDATVEKAAVAASPLQRATVDSTDKRLIGRTLDITQRGVPGTRTNLAELSMNKNKPATFAVKDTANTKSVLFAKQATNTTKTAAPAKIDVTQVVKQRPALKVNGLDVLTQNKAAATQTPAAKSGTAALTINGQAVLTNTASATTPTATSATTPAASGATTPNRVRLSAKERREQIRDNARKARLAEEAKQTAEAK